MNAEVSEPRVDEGNKPVYQMILEQISALRREQQTGFANMRSEFNDRIGHLVSSDMLIAEQRRVDDRFEEVHRLLILSETRMNKFIANVRWVIAVLVLPAVLFIVDLIARRL